MSQISEEELQARRSQHALAQSHYRNELSSQLSPEELQTRRSQHAENQAQSRALTNEQEIHSTQTVDSFFPSDMPSDSYFDTHEKNPIASLSFLWARTGNWSFEKYRNSDFAQLDAEEQGKLIQAIKHSTEITDADAERCMNNYYHRMNPTLPSQACSCCGILDVPIDESILVPNLKEGDIIKFHDVDLSSSLLTPLYYTNEENAQYDSVPSHIENNEENRTKWLTYRYYKLHS
jgi:hypothetical protein